MAIAKTIERWVYSACLISQPNDETICFFSCCDRVSQFSHDRCIDLVDEHEAIDANGNGRAFITVNLNWKHAEPFFDLKPTGREGTSVETFIFTVRSGKVIRFGVADNTLDLSIYLWERGWPQVHNIRPTAIVTGIERR